jgi:hypothetical protein
MTAPTQYVRTLTYERDGFACVSCGAMSNLQWNHRSSSGHGGRGKKAPKLTPSDGVTSCANCNPRYEADLQTKALASGWKLRRNRLLASHEVPFWNRNTSEWWLPDADGGKQIIHASLALELIEAAGGLTRAEVAS